MELNENIACKPTNKHMKIHTRDKFLSVKNFMSLCMFVCLCISSLGS